MDEFNKQIINRLKECGCTTGTLHAISIVERVLNEAKQEFPCGLKCIYYSHHGCDDYVNCGIKDWFEKWFEK